MQVTKEQVDPCTIKLGIEVEPELVNRGFDRAYREFNGFTTVPGFRPGKAPRKMLERYVNQDRLRDRVVELVAAPAYREALEKEQITPYSDPEVEFGDIAEDRTWQFTATVPTPPSVTLGEIDGISVERPVYSATDEDVEATITKLREEHSRLTPAHGRGVMDGDVIIAESTITPEGEAPAPEPRRSLIRIGNNIPGFDDAVLGQTVDEEREFDLVYPEDYQDKELAGKSAHFVLTVRTITEKVVPELTDDWVREVTESQSVDELRADTRERLERGLSEMSERITETRIVHALIARSQIQYPAVMVREEMEAQARELGERIRDQMTYEEWLKASGMTEEEHGRRMAVEAEERVTTVLLLRELARAENVNATEDEIDREFEEIAKSPDVTPEQVAGARNDKGRRAQVANTIVKRKLRDLLMSRATITDVPAPR